MTSHYALYRSSSIGNALTDTLDSYVANGQLSPQLAMRILLQFDKTISEMLSSKVKTKATIKGHLQTYRFCDDVWTFIIQDANFRMDGDSLAASKVKVVACNAKKPGEA